MKLRPLSLIQTAFSLLLITLVITQLLRPANAIVRSIDSVGNETDLIALLAIKSQLNDDHANDGILSSWNHSLHHCFWEGVICVRKHNTNRVIELNLGSRGLGGTISPLIGNLSFLRSISLENNILSGQIPPEIGRLHRLRSLNLYNNTLDGEIPSNISGCINLQNLSVADNYLHGELPVGIGALSNLKTMWVYSNKLSGSFFGVIANLTSLESVNGSFNAFTGTIPHSISRMRHLIEMFLVSNKLSGTIPPSIFNLSSLQYLSLGSNHLRGSIPPYIASTLPRMQWLSLFDNYLSGTLPPSIQNLTHIQVLDLGGNNLTGRYVHLHNLQYLNVRGNYFVGDINFIISDLVNCSKLEALDVTNNRLTGALPNLVSNLSKSLVDLFIGGNRLSGGIIPRGISNLINLRSIDMIESKISGTIPQELGNLQRLENLYLYSNKLTGEIPSTLKNLSRLSILSLFDNHLQGSIPPSLGNYESLLYVYLFINNFKGSLPRELFIGSAKFIVLFLSQNQLEGSLPVEISEQVNMVEFDVSQNKLSGEIPPSLGNLFGLHKLYMNDNLFHGLIPSSFASLKSLEVIDLSHNNISGPIPEYFSAFPLSYLNLSYNNFEGKVPINGAFANASILSLVGNNRLCGGIMELHLLRCVEKKGKKKRMSRALKSKFVIFCAFGGVLAMAIIITMLYQKSHMRKRICGSSYSTMKEQFLKVSYNMLLKATNRFSQENLLGSGTFGYVYIGILDGNQIAVKVLNLQHRGGTKSFMAECKALGNVRHRNLVRIITACSSIDFQGNEFKALVYEFMPNGSLDRWLHGEGNLNLLQRVDIAIDVAHAVNHLHHGCEDTIVHCDLKPGNILLDNDLVAHVADLGLAKVLGQPINPNQSSSIGVRGTIGYVAPEYGLGGEASLEADLYSYGIILLELMTRKRPTDSVFQGDFNLHTYAKAALPDQVMQFVDSELRKDDDHENEEVDTMRPRTPERLRQRDKCIKMVLEVGVACSDQLPHNRMKISAAISKLQQARNNILNPGNRRNLARGARS